MVVVARAEDRVAAQAAEADLAGEGLEAAARLKCLPWGEVAEEIGQEAGPESIACAAISRNGTLIRFWTLILTH